MSFEVEKKTGWGEMGFHFFSNIQCYFFPLSSYMLKSVVELDYFPIYNILQITFPNSRTFIKIPTPPPLFLFGKTTHISLGLVSTPMMEFS